MTRKKIMTKNGFKTFQFDMVLIGKSARKMYRAKIRSAEKKGILESPLGKMRPRRERKSIAKSLKVLFFPRYNGMMFKLEHKPFKNEKGYVKYKSELVLVSK
jgi:hypothetical protein